jgi:antitoxin (DNA-binding transcriptional repressor) of toxin-antitoxin stability system
LVAAGETVEVTNNGQVAAVITPPGSDVLTRLGELGQTRPARRSVADVRTIRRRPAKLSSADIVKDVRGEW